MLSLKVVILNKTARTLPIQLTTRADIINISGVHVGTTWPLLAYFHPVSEPQHRVVCCGSVMEPVLQCWKTWNRIMSALEKGCMSVRFTMNTFFGVFRAPTKSILQWPHNFTSVFNLMAISETAITIIL